MGKGKNKSNNKSHNKSENKIQSIDKRQFLKYLLTFVGLIFIFNLTLLLSSLFSSDYIYENVKESAEILQEEGDFVYGPFNSIIENTTDGLIINETYSIDSEEPFKSYMLCRKNYKKGVTTNELFDENGQLHTFSQDLHDEEGNPVPDNGYFIMDELVNLLDGKVTTSRMYTRYYHGYLILFRPLLLIMNITQIRTFVTVLFLALLCWFGYYAYKKLGFRIMVLSVVSLILFGYFGVSISLEQSPLFLVTMVGTCILLMNIEKFDDKKMMYFLFIIGMLTCFFDYFTVPLISLLFPLFIYFMYQKQFSGKNKPASFKELLLLIIKFCLFWGLGYTLTWLSKVILVGIIFGLNSFESFFGQMFFRTAGNIGEFEARIEQIVLPHTFKVLVRVTIVMLLISLISKKWKINSISKSTFIENLDIIMLLAISFGWMLVAFNHTIYHFDLFPYRNLLIPVLVILTILFGKETKEDSKTSKLKQGKISKYVSAFVELICIFNIALLVACLIPSSMVEDNVRSSAETIMEEGPYFEVPFFGGNNNEWTDAVITNEIYSVDSNDPFVSYMCVRKNYKEGQTQIVNEEENGEGITANYDNELNREVVDLEYDSIGELSDFLDGNIVTAINYGRYWHGYLSIYRPLFVITDISGVRMLQLIAYVVLFVVLIYLINNKFNFTIATIYAVSIAFCGYFSAAYSLESGSIFLIMMISSIIFLRKMEKFEDVGLFFFVVGMITNYFDYLTVPLITCGIPLTLFLLNNREKISLEEAFISMLKFGLLWGLGYAFTWIFKWILYDITIHGEKSMLEIGFLQSFYRMQRENVTTNFEFSDILLQIFEPCLKPIIINTCAMLVLGIFGEIKQKKKIFKAINLDGLKENLADYVLIPILLMPLAWYILLKNHTLIHSYFTYRLIVIFVLGLSLLIYLKFVKRKD